MKRGSTPTHVFSTNVDLTNAIIYITYSQNGEVVCEKSGDDIVVEKDSISCSLSQQDTLEFKNGEVRIQVRYVKESGEADASNIITTSAEEILKEGVI